MSVHFILWQILAYFLIDGFFCIMLIIQLPLSLQKNCYNFPINNIKYKVKFLIAIDLSHVLSYDLVYRVLVLRLYLCLYLAFKSFMHNLVYQNLFTCLFRHARIFLFIWRLLFISVLHRNELCCGYILYAVYNNAGLIEWLLGELFFFLISK